MKKKFIILTILPFFCSCSMKYSYKPSHYDLIGVSTSTNEYVLPLNTSVYLQMYNDKELDLIKNQFKNKIHYIHSIVDSYHSYDNIFNIHDLNLSTSNQKYYLDETLFEIIKNAINITKLSKGIFNLTLGNVIDVWNPYFNENIYNNDPNITSINNALKSVVNYQELDDYLILNEKEKSIIIKEYHNHKININLGALAKGYALDYINDLFINNEPAIISCGNSSISLKGDFPFNNKKYTIYLKEPLIGNNIIHNEYLLKLDIDKYYNISTSGIDQKYYINQNNEIRHHILSPNDGYSKNYHKSITVISKCNSYILDSLSTILMNIETIDEIKKIIELFEKNFNTSIDYCIVDTFNKDNFFNVYINENINKKITSNYSSKIKNLTII